MARIITIILCCLLVGCSGPPQTPVQTPADHLASIPTADAKKYEKFADMKKWQNPYLIIRSDGVGLLDASNNEVHILKLEEVLDALAKLPPSAWPYGRVVAVQEQSAGLAGDDRTAMRRNRSILAGTLIEAKVLIDWVPAS
jgi:hypothetical protein